MGKNRMWRNRLTFSEVFFFSKLKNQGYIFYMDILVSGEEIVYTWVDCGLQAVTSEGIVRICHLEWIAELMT